MRRLTAVLALGVVAAGCDSGREVEAGGPIVSDSAGVRLVQYPGPLVGDSVLPQELWRHGILPDDYAFQFVSAGVLDGADGFIVVDGGNGEIVRIDGHGIEFSTLAPNGRGPNEVLRPRIVIPAENGGVWVDDPGNGRVLGIEDGEVVATINTRAGPSSGVRAMPVAEDATGDFLMVTSAYRSDFDEEWLHGHLTRLSIEDLVVDTVGTYPLAMRRPRDGGINPFSPAGHVTGAGHRWVHARSDRAELTWRNPDGSVSQVMRWNPIPEYATPAMWEAFVAILRADLERVNPQLGGDRLESFVNEQLDRYSIDQSAPLPLFGRPVGTSSGEVWLPTYSPDRRSRNFMLMSASGVLVALISFPEPVQVLDASTDRVLVRVQDDSDVDAVALYDFERPR